MNDPRILSGQEMVNRRLLAPYDKALRRTVDHIDALTEALDAERAKVAELDAALTVACADTDDAERRLDAERARVEKLERVVKVYRFELLRLDDMFVRAAYYINGQPVHEDYAVRPSRPSWFPEGSSGQRISQALAALEATDE